MKKKKYKKIIALFCAALLALFTTSCTPRETTAQPVTYRIVASFYPIYIMTLNLTQGLPDVEVTDMAGQQTGCLHDYQLQSKDVQALARADVFAINGAGMENFLTRVMDQLPDLQILDSSAGIPVLQSGEGGAESENPHLWVSISNYIKQVENLADGLAADDPAHADAYRENAAVYIEKLSSLRSRMHETIDPLPNRDIVTLHEAFPYFAEEFGLTIVGTVQREPDSQPSARELADTIRLIRSTGVKAVFAEPQYDASAAQILSQESGAAFYTLDPGATGPDDPDAYLDAMEQNRVVLQKALA